MKLSMLGDTKSWKKYTIPFLLKDRDRFQQEYSDLEFMIEMRLKELNILLEKVKDKKTEIKELRQKMDIIKTIDINNIPIVDHIDQYDQ